MTETVTLVCRVDSLNDKSYIDRQVATLLRSYKAHLVGRRSDLTLTSELERKYSFHELSADDAVSIKAIATENQSRLCVKRVEIGSGSETQTLTSPPTSPATSPKLVVPSPSSPSPPSPPSSPSSPSSAATSSISSNTKSLVLNFGVGDDSGTTSGGSDNNSFFSSDSETSGIGVGVGTQVATPEILLLRELADIMTIKSVKPTPSQIGKAVSTWFVRDNVQKVMRRIV